jgi:hydroxyisourate hydrolase
VDLARLNALPSDAAAREFQQCCGSTRWANAMADARPFASVEALIRVADRAWAGLERQDWLEAFEAHPRIGAGGAARSGGSSESGPAGGEDRETRRDAKWSAAEQSGVASASQDVLARLAEANREYEARFGYIFIVCATGKTADEMLALVERRIGNLPDAELRIAAEEQRKITRLRLAKSIESTRMITTHVLDTARGVPASGVAVTLEMRRGSEWIRVGQGATDATGRLTTLGEGQSIGEGTYRLTFDTAAYHRANGVTNPFFVDVRVAFVVSDGGSHYHVPLLLSPFGYSTYRGS